MGERTREIQRLHNLLEDAGIKLTTVVSDVMGKSGRAMLKALIAGEHDPGVMAEWVLGQSSFADRSLDGRFTDHHGFLTRAMLDRIDSVTEMQSRLDAHR